MDANAFKTYYDSPIGRLMIAGDGENLKGLWVEEQKYFGASLSDSVIEDNQLLIFVQTKDWLDRYFAGEKPEIAELPLAPNGGEFRQSVWKILYDIPYGEVLTYGDIAKMMAAKRGKSTMSAQAVGGAVGHNPISIIIPCHRVVGSGGSLTGYASGVERKIQLLKFEGVDVSKFTVPTKGTAI